MSAEAVAASAPTNVRARPWLADLLLVAAAFAASAAVLWFVTHELLVVLGFACGLIALAGMMLTLRRSAPPAQSAELALPDWSVTVAAIDRPDAGIAITDRAGRLVCANACYEAWFGISHAPPLLPVDAAALPGAMAAARPICSTAQPAAGGRKQLAAGAARIFWSGASCRLSRPILRRNSRINCRANSAAPCRRPGSPPPSSILQA